MRQQYPRATDLSLTLCHCCGLLNPLIHKTQENQKRLKCSRCHSTLHHRKPRSLERTTALMIAASILYIPANVLPMTITGSLLGYQQDTIMSGVIYFWQNGDYLVSTVIFMASIVIPMLKLVLLCLLLLAVQMQSSQRWHFSPEHCSILYRIVEFVGRWSMIDVFVVALLTALIQIQSLATILAGPGSVAFGAVVVLTMFASLSFDPRIIWDNYYSARGRYDEEPQSLESTSIIQVEASHLNNDFSNFSK
ncbi:paraquat-inducible protein A [Acinetobacter sp. ANC 4648]|uniref:paraquat-inducible protein A n=1 Tax=Acinetobacter sp. ANC 4648 TaxID=1977875 RepID=UPI003A4C6193